MATASPPPARLVVLASGNGSNLQAVVDACADGRLAARVVAVVCDRPDALALVRARQAAIPAVPLARLADEPRRTYDGRLAAEVSAHEPDLVVLAGWMRILTTEFLGRFPNRVINLHPALPGELPGTNAIERAWHEAMAGERTRSGVMVHYVPDEGVDDGPVIASEPVPIRPDDSLERFEARVHAVEHRLLVDTIRTLTTPAAAAAPSNTPT